jgi:hypothetical protein
VTFEGLLAEMTDLERLAAWPDPAYTTAQASSYDRRSTDPAVATDENWFANYDRGQYLYVEERGGAEEFVIMDEEGPGAIVRFWSANPNEGGTVRIYLDEAPEPAIETSLQDWLTGEHPIAPSPIAGVRSAGTNNHLPIPYARHCKITISEPNIYYQIGFRTYADGAEVETFTMAAAEAARERIGAVARALGDAGPAAVTGPAAAAWDIELGPGEDAGLELDGPAAIRRLTCAVDAADKTAALRSVVLRITFDGADQPQVVAPLGDFFGSAPGHNPFRSLPCGMLDDGTMYANWVMPFGSRAAVQVVNHSGQPVRLSGEAHTMPHDWTDASLYFNAGWRAEFDIPTQPRQDWNFVTVEGGKGRYVGNALHITNPIPEWWGEGDEKVYVDGETFPSTFGTGTEDYYGYAWCNPALFTHAYHNQPRCDGPANYGHTSNNRFHVIDDIPFNERFVFDMEVWHWIETEVSYAATSYWYERPGATDNLGALEPASLRVEEVEQFPGVEGALEGEKMAVLEVTGGSAMPQTGAYGWSRGAQMWWLDPEPGDELTIGFTVEEAGRYQVVGNLTRAVDYGIHALRINDQPVLGPIDFFATEVTTTGPVSLGRFDLAEGENMLHVRVEGHREGADPRHMFGLDYLLLEPVE